MADVAELNENFDAMVLAMQSARLDTGKLHSSAPGTDLSDGTDLPSGGVTQMHADVTAKSAQVQANANAVAAASAAVVAVASLEPEEAPGYLRGWRADHVIGVADGGAVAAMPDASGNADPAANATAGQQPSLETNELGGRPVLRFAEGKRLSFTKATTVRTVIVVAKHATGNQDYGTLLGDTATFHFQGGAGALLLDPVYAHANVRNGKLYVDGVDTTIATATKPTAWKVLVFVTAGPVEASLIASDRNTAGRFWNGDIAEIHLLADPIDAATTQRVTNAVRARYAMDGAALAPPSGLAVTETDPLTATLAFTDNAAGELGYRIYRREGVGGTYGTGAPTGQPWQQVGVVAAGVTTFADRVPRTARKYVYRVAGVGNSARTGYSGPAALTPGSPLCVCDGNSLIADSTFVARLKNYLAGNQDGAAAVDPGWSVQSTAVSGQKTTDMITRYPTHVAPLYDPARSKNVYVLWEVINHIFFNGTLAAVKQAVLDLTAMARATGFAVIWVTPTPRSNVGTPANYEADRWATYLWMRQVWRLYADGLADITADKLIGAAGAQLNPYGQAIYSVDQVHFLDAGHARSIPVIGREVLGV